MISLNSDLLSGLDEGASGQYKEGNRICSSTTPDSCSGIEASSDMAEDDRRL